MKRHLTLVALVFVLGFWSKRSYADNIAGYVVSGHTMASGYGWAYVKIATRNTPPIPNGTIVTITIPIDLDPDVAHLMIEALAASSTRYTTFYGLSPESGPAGFYDVTPSTLLDITGLSQIQVVGLSAGAASMARLAHLNRGVREVRGR